MRHKLCRSFHPWCTGVKTRCFFFSWWIVHTRLEYMTRTCLSCFFFVVDRTYMTRTCLCSFCCGASYIHDSNCLSSFYFLVDRTHTTRIHDSNLFIFVFLMVDRTYMTRICLSSSFVVDRTYMTRTCFSSFLWWHNTDFKGRHTLIQVYQSFQLKSNQVKKMFISVNTSYSYLNIHTETTFVRKWNVPIIVLWFFIVIWFHYLFQSNNDDTRQQERKCR